MKFLIFLTFFSVPTVLGQEDPVPFDFVEDALLKYRNMSVDPCENFYRHACSFDSPPDLTGAAFEEVMERIDQLQENAYFKHLNLINDYKTVVFKINPLTRKDATVDFLTESVGQICDKNIELAQALSSFFAKVLSNEDVTEKSLNPQKLKEGSTCTSIVESIGTSINEAFTDDIIDFWRDLPLMYQKVSTLANRASQISAHVDVDVRYGIEGTRKMVLDILKLAESLIAVTPWVKNQHLVERIENITSEMVMHDNFAKDYEVITNALVGADRAYMNCRVEISYVENNDVLCYLLTAVIKVEEMPYIDRAFFLEDNAVNAHPNLFFGYPNYYHTQYGREMASKLGYTGFSAGHEIGHTFFDNHDHPDVLPGFSKNVENCVQSQYNETCAVYKEESCATTSDFLDENGADVFGLQLAYELLKDHYRFDLHNTIDRLQVTYHQLFFYSFAYQFCSGYPATVHPVGGEHYDPHSAVNIRVNVAANHPGFQVAFGCSSDSKMIKSATEQCMIYGYEAPETRKRRRFNRALNV